MIKIKSKYLIEFSLYLMIIGFVYSVSINGKINLNKIAIGIRAVSIFLQFYLISKKFNSKKVIICLGLIILILIYTDKQWIYFLQIYLICDILKKYSYRYINKLFRKVSLLSIIIVFFNYYIGLSSYKLLYGFIGQEIYKRETYGLVHPNTLSLLFLSFIIMDYLSKKKLLRTMGYLLGVYFFTKTRSIIFLFFIFYFLLKISKLKKMNKFLNIIGQYMPLLLLLTLLLSKKILFKSAYYNLNNILSDRLELWNYNFSRINIKEFFFGTNYISRIMDNSYLMIHNFGGIFLVLLYFILYFQTIRKLRKFKKNDQLIYLISFGILFNFESSLLIPGYIFSIYYWVILLKKNKWRVKNEKNISYSSSL